MKNTLIVLSTIFIMALSTNAHAERGDKGVNTKEVLREYGKRVGRYELMAEAVGRFKDHKEKSSLEKENTRLRAENERMQERETLRQKREYAKTLEGRGTWRIPPENHRSPNP